MRSLLILAAALSIAGCDSVQGAVDNADYICKDGVEYFVYSKVNTSGSVGYSVVPHFKPDGSLYTCTRKVQ